MNRPMFIAKADVTSPAAVETAIATLLSALQPDALVLLALHLDAMKKERAIGHLGVEFHMYRGDVRGVNFERRTSWQRHEPLREQITEKSPKP